MRAQIAACGIAAAGIGFVGSAEATVSKTYTFTVRITQQDPAGILCPANGTLVPLTITVDRGYPFTPPKNRTEVYAGGPAIQEPSPILNVTFGSSTTNGPAPFDDIYVYKNAKGISGYSFLAYSVGGGGYTITFSTSKTGNVRSFRLPASIDPSDFSTATFEVSSKVPCYGEIVER